MERRSVGLFATGIVLTALGGVVFIAGLATVAIGASCNSDGSCDGTTLTNGGIATGIGGTVMIAGIVMAVVGGQRVPVATAMGVQITPILTPKNWGLQATF
jgi:hypothetical protein